MPARPLNELNQHMDKWIWSSDLFWSKVKQAEEDDDCWTWTGSTGRQGPLFGMYIQENHTRKPRMVSARRVMYAETFDCWLKPEEPIYHGCGNRDCLNPGHFTRQRPKHDIYQNYRERNDKSTNTY